jgi:hypothetical protein
MELKQTSVLIVRQGSKEIQYSFHSGESLLEGIDRVLRLYRNQICFVSCRSISYIDHPEV